MAVHKRFSRLKYPVHELSEKDSLEEKFPKLFKLQEFAAFKHKQKDKIIKYIIFLYDKGTDLFDEFEELKERKDAAATEAGWKRNNKDEWPNELQEIMTLEDDDVIPLILAYLKDQNHNVWRDIQVTEQEYDMIIEQRMTPIPTIDKKDSAEIMIKRKGLQEMSDQCLTRLTALKRQFYADNSDVEEKAKEIPPIRPENADRVIKMYADVS